MKNASLFSSNVKEKPKRAVVSLLNKGEEIFDKDKWLLYRAYGLSILIRDKKETTMNRTLTILLFTVITLSTSTPAQALYNQITTRKDIVLPNDGKRNEETASLTISVPCIIKAGKHATKGFTSGGILIDYIPVQVSDQGECGAGMHFIPRSPVELE